MSISNTENEIYSGLAKLGKASSNIAAIAGTVFSILLIVGGIVIMLLKKKDPTPQNPHPLEPLPKWFGGILIAVGAVILVVSWANRKIVSSSKPAQALTGFSTILSEI